MIDGLNNQAGIQIETFSIALTYPFQRSFSVNLPVGGFRTLAVSVQGSILTLAVAMVDGFVGQRQLYRFYVYSNAERIEHFLDNHLGTIYYAERIPVHVFGPRGDDDPHLRWMGNPADPEFHEPEFILRRVRDSYVSTEHSGGLIE